MPQLGKVPAADDGCVPPQPNFPSIYSMLDRDRADLRHRTQLGRSLRDLLTVRVLLEEVRIRPKRDRGIRMASPKPLTRAWVA